MMRTRRPLCLTEAQLQTSIGAIDDRAEDYAAEVERRYAADTSYRSADIARAASILRCLDEGRAVRIRSAKPPAGHDRLAIVLGPDAALHLLDAVLERRRLYERTALYHDAALVSDGRDGETIAECRDAAEARRIAAHYRKLAARLRAALGRSDRSRSDEA